LIALAGVFLEFFLSVFESLRAQVGPQFTSDTITMFLSLVEGTQLAVIMSRDQGSGVEFVAKFIALLRIIVEEPGKSMEPFVPSVITLSIQQLYPVIRSGHVSWRRKKKLCLMFFTIFLINQKLRYLAVVGGNCPRFALVLWTCGEHFVESVEIFLPSFSCIFHGESNK
jgi:hypothetical protein